MATTTTVSATSPAQALALANRLRPVLLHLGRHLRREVHETGVTAGQVSLLASLCRRPDTGVNELAAIEGISAPSMSNAIDKLEAAGLVQRVRGTEGDRRRVSLRVTAEGERIVRTVRSRRNAWLSSRLRGLSPEEFAAVEAAIEPLIRIVGAE
jgi:DNA-binding MarR family transcriptional regulator